MATAKNQRNRKGTNAKTTQTAAKKQEQNRREITGIFCLLAALFAFLCCFNTDAFLIGKTALLFGGLFGQTGRYALPVLLTVIALVLFRSKNKPVKLRIFCAATLIITLAAFVHIFIEIFDGDVDFSVSVLYTGGKETAAGGFFPGLLAELLEAALTKVGALIALLLLTVWEILTCMGITVNSLITAIKNRPRLQEEEEAEPEPEVDPAVKLVNRVQSKRLERRKRKTSISEYDLPVDDPPIPPSETDKQNAEKQKLSRVPSPDEYLEQSRAVKAAPNPAPIAVTQIEMSAPEPLHDPVSGMPELKREVHTEQAKKGEIAAQAGAVSEEIAAQAQQAVPEYIYPSIQLLHFNKQSFADATTEMRENSQRLADVLQSFGIEPHIVNVTRGPSVTLYELMIDPGVKLSKITNLSNDIALSLGASGVRISAIPEKNSVVGIEVPNKAVNTVFIREVIDSAAFKKSPSCISFAVGKDISGNCIIGDIAKLPHMLIAGTTGSGKSVCMNTLIVSLLYKAKPEEVRMIMIDPKMVELGGYNGIPHLLIPVVTDPKKASGALQWTVTEMMRRYQLMSAEGVRDVESYNKAVQNDTEQTPLPQIVVVIDELADMMLVAAKEVEESICRIAQMGRASGIHLIIATQRPSADVITGLMKANIPSRIAFAVASAMESRIILDTQGADKLVGKGDMLFAPLGQGKPKRVQGCFITDDEVQAVVAAVKEKSESDYSSEIMEQIERRAEQNGKSGAAADTSRSSAGSETDGDELLPAAVEVILETGQASVSMLQRRLKLGYARAARIVDEMEERGIVGPFEGAKPRQLLISREQWLQMQNGTYEPDNAPVEEELP